MVRYRNQKGITMITLVITIVVIIILAAIAMRANDNTIDEASSVKFKQEITDVKRGVETVKLINSKQGLDEEIINQGFKKVYVENPPDIFVSIEEDNLTAYLIDLEKIDYNKLNTGQEYNELNEYDTVTFDEDDVYVYDKLGTVYYVKGIYIEGSGTVYTADETRIDGPLVEAENTTGGIVRVKVTPTNSGEITSVTVGGKIATKVEGEDGIYEAEMDENGSYIVTATEEGSGTSKTVVQVTKIEDDGSEDSVAAPTIAEVRINNGESYTRDDRAIVNIITDAELILIKHVTTNVIPSTPTAQDSGWRNYTETSTLVLSEGNNDVYVWFRNKGNDTIISASANIILDTTPPTSTKPDVEVFDEHSFRVTAKQKDLDPPRGSGLKKIEVGYKLVDDDEYTWITVPDITNPTVEIINNRPNEAYKIITRAEDNAGNIAESQEFVTEELNDIPGGVVIEYSPTTGWTRRSTVKITYPLEANDLYQKWYRLAGGEWQVADDFEETLYIEENMTIDAVVVKQTGTETIFGEIESVTINNIDTINPIISEIKLDPVNITNNEDYRGLASLIDNESGIVAYIVTESEFEPTSWNYLEDTKNSIDISYDAMVGHRYYIWVKDAAENIGCKYVDVEAIEFVLGDNIKATVPQEEYVYTGLEIEPEVTVTYLESTLREDLHYTVAYENNVNVGTAKIIITGQRAYSGVIEITFKITPATPTLTLEDTTHKYDRGVKTINEVKAVGTPNGTQPAGAVTYTYYTNSTLTSKTTSTNGASATGGAPTKEGSYYVVAKMAPQGNYGEATSNTAILTIQPSSMTVTFNVNGGNAISETSRTVYYDHTYGENGALPTPTRTNYKFLGWFDAASGGTQKTASSNVDTNGNHTLYAQWQLLEVTVTFNGNGGYIYVNKDLTVDTTDGGYMAIEYPTSRGSTTTVSLTLIAGNQYSKLPEPSDRSYYEFIGWYTSASGGSRVYATSSIKEGDHTLYARWEAEPCWCDECDKTEAECYDCYSCGSGKHCVEHENCDCCWCCGDDDCSTCEYECGYPDCDKCTYHCGGHGSTEEEEEEEEESGSGSTSSACPCACESAGYCNPCSITCTSSLSCR